MPRQHRTTHILGGKRGATCADLLALLNRYVDGGVQPSICKGLEGHLRQCKPCRVVVDNIRHTLTLYRNEVPCELPTRFRARLHARLRQCWKKTRR